MLYLLSTLSVMYILLMYYISLLLLPSDGFVLCYIGLLVLTLWRFDDDVISPSPGKGRYNMTVLRLGLKEINNSNRGRCENITQTHNVDSLTCDGGCPPV